ncbi:MAG: molybdopterin-dependent oxidoreductase [Coriobacteriales bacterium]|jgi:thiosulfate reductase/polysulfide reductase chain A|nr:molybdopterin-dependent oxidoreductase [Coriobacteriales bacterium]
MSGVTTLDSWLTSRAHAKEGTGYVTVATSCNACTNKCGVIAYVKDGRLWKLKGNAAHPYSKGTVCARGHGYAQILYSADRLTEPLKRNRDGSYSAISWENAYREIGERVRAILAKDGPEALAIVEDPRPNGKYYSKRFINALGSNNYYTHNATCNLSLSSGYQATFGGTNFSADIASSKLVVFIGRSYGDGMRPSSAATLARAAESGVKIVLVDPRLNNTGIFASQWLPVNPGTDLALLLAIANVLVAEGLYDKTFVAEQTTGFDEWAVELAKYPPEWAEGITGIPADTMTALARELGAAGPKGVIEQGWRGAFGCQYRNSFNTARAIAAINALLGNWNRKGGALITHTPKAGALDAGKFPTPVQGPQKAGVTEYPLQTQDNGTNLIVVKQGIEGKMKGVFFYNSNAVKAYANPRDWKDALAKMELTVCIDVQMSETAHQCDYVLPECSYLERDELPEFLGGKQGCVAGRFKAVEKVHPETRASDVIYAELAEACGVGEYFRFSCEELARAQLESVSVSYDELREKGVVNLGEPFAYDEPPTWKTPSGKFEFVSQKIAATEGLKLYTPLITWVEPKVSPGADTFRLIGGKQSIHSHTMTTSIESLMNITREYALERAWINAARAAELGIADGDTIEVRNELFTATVRARVTERLNPTALWIPTHYGGSSPELRQGFGVGIPHMEYVPFDIEPDVGSAMTHEALVTIRKVSA